MIIFPRHKLRWVTSESFTKWLDPFIKIFKSSSSYTVLLILDGHYSHTRNIELTDLAKQNYVTIHICLPPHSTHKMQPLDIGFMSTLKTYYAQEVENWLSENLLQWKYHQKLLKKLDWYPSIALSFRSRFSISCIHSINTIINRKCYSSTRSETISDDSARTGKY